ncbi:MAG: hypothetical protein H7336_15370 [Bacteriovorax sp.]|nr:hypothetical protein [Bacteriovorax sp.]
MKTSRLLNEKSGFFGLSVLDLGLIGYFLILTHSVLSMIGLELLSFVFTSIVAVLLIHVRLTQRKHIIRDFLKFYFTKKQI